MPEQSKLEQIAIEQRNNLLAMNTFNQTSNNGYGVTHTRAKSDSETPIQGKGTGEYMDIYNGGGSYDINGVPGAFGSGRIGNLASNEYNYTNTYEAPDTTLNIGQIVL